MNIINRSKLRKMANDSCCNEIDMLRVLKVSDPSIEIVIVDDMDNIFPYSLSLINQIKEELNFDYVRPNNKLHRTL